MILNDLLLRGQWHTLLKFNEALNLWCHAGSTKDWCVELIVWNERIQQYSQPCELASFDLFIIRYGHWEHLVREQTVTSVDTV